MLVVSGRSGCPYLSTVPTFDKVGEQYADTLISGKINLTRLAAHREALRLSSTIPTLLLYWGRHECSPAPLSPPPQAALVTIKEAAGTGDFRYEAQICMMLSIVIGGGFPRQTHTAAPVCRPCGHHAGAGKALRRQADGADGCQIDNYPALRTA